MHIILTVAIATFFVFAFWNDATSGNAGPNVANSIDPTAMTLNPADMPAQQFLGP
jgi:hypothetical protein